MNFAKKIKIRMYLGLFYIIIGIIINAFGGMSKQISGGCFIIIGICFFVKNLRILKDEKRMYRLEIYENDERNIQITLKARSLATLIFTMFLALSVFVFDYLGKEDLAVFAGVMLMVFLAVYFLCYTLMRKKY